MVIRELKPSQHVQGRWLIQLDNGELIRVGESEVVACALYTGKELTGAEVDALQAAARRSGLKEKAIELLARKPMSRWELERKLEQWEAGEEESAAICDRMEELGFLNDAEYAGRVARHYSAKGYGERKLRDELYRRGISRELWPEALEQVEDPADALDSFVAKKLAGRTPDRKELKKVSDALARRGFGWSEINDALRRYGAQVEDEI